MQNSILKGNMKVFKSAQRHLISLIVVMCCFIQGSEWANAQPPTPVGSYTTFPSGFTQAVFGHTGDFFGGIAFAPDGDVWVDNCLFSGGTLYRFDLQSTTTDGTHALVQTSTGLTGCGLTNHPNGNLYSNTSAGVAEISNPTNDATAPSLLRTFGPAGNALGITVDPQTTNLVYVGADCRFTATCTIYSLDPSSGSSSVFAHLEPISQFADGIAFDPSGNFLFVSNRAPSFHLTIVNRSGLLVQSVAVSSEPDGIAFHAQSPQFVVTDNTDGTMTRFDFPNNDFTQTPTVSTFASGGFRGDLSQVGADSCVYLSQAGTRLSDNSTSTDNSIEQICGGFAPGAGTATQVVSNTFTPQNPTQIYIYNSGDPTNEHSWKASTTVNSSFTLSVSATEVDGDGVCVIPSTGNADDSTDFDCRLATFFGVPAPPFFSGETVTVPRCVPYSHGHCVDYHVINAPPPPGQPGSPYSSPVNFYIAYNATTGIGPFTGWQPTPDMYDDPSDDANNCHCYPTITGTPPRVFPYSPEDGQFVFDITTYFNPTGKAGDSGIGGKGGSFNDFVVAYPIAPSSPINFAWVSPLSPNPAVASFKMGTTIPVKFALNPDTPPGSAVVAPNHVGFTIVQTTKAAGCNDLNGTREALAFPGGSPTSITYNSTKLQYQVNLSERYPVGFYGNVLVNSNLFGTQCATFVVTK